jgi:hypothetical protein
VGNIADGAGGERVTSKGSAELEVGNIVPGVFTPVLAKHSKSFSLIDCISVGVDRMQRNFEPMQRQVEAWQRFELTDVTAKVSSSRRHSWRGDSRRPNTSPVRFTICILNRGTTSFGRGPSRAGRMRSRLRSRNWSRFRNLRRSRNWESLSFSNCPAMMQRWLS